MAVNRHMGAAALAAGAVGVATSATLNKLGINAGLHPIWLNALRLGFSIAVMLPFFLLRARARLAQLRMLPRDRLLTLLSGCMLAIHFATWTASLKFADSVVAMTIWSTYSLMTVIGSSLLLKERTPLPALIGMLVAVIGVGICAIGASNAQFFGVLMALCAALSQAVYTLCGRVVRKRVDVLPYTMGVYTVAFVCLLASAPLVQWPPQGLNAGGVGASLLLALICTLGGHSLQNYALKFYKAPTISMVTLTEVFTGPILVYFVLGESPEAISFIGGAIIMTGVGWYVLYEAMQKRKQIH